MTTHPQEFHSESPGVPDYSYLNFRSKKNNTALVIPVINESYRIINQLKKISSLNLGVDVIIADGGSTDESSDYFREKVSGISTLLIKNGNGRLSAQLRMAFHYCLRSKYDFVITMDGNDKDDPQGIAKIQQALLEGYDFVQGSRFVSDGKGVNTPLARMLAIKLIHAPITSIASRKKYTDTTNGFRGYSARFLKSEEVGIFRPVFDSYELLAYLPIRATKLKFTTKEVGVIRSYPTDSGVPTKIVGITPHLQILRILIRAALNHYSPKMETKGNYD